MSDSGLPGWVLALGTLLTIVGGGGLFGLIRVLTKDMPRCSLEPDYMDGVFKLIIKNPGQQTILIRWSTIRPLGNWFIAPNAMPATARGRQSLRYGPKAHTQEDRQTLRFTIGPGQSHVCFLNRKERDLPLTFCLIVLNWQPSGGLPMPRLPAMIWKTKTALADLLVSSRGREIRSA